MTTPASAAIDAEHPWLGLASFSEETLGYFYGREDEVAELSRRVQRKLLTVLFGQSGLGKTSILRAGIVPRLRPQGHCPVPVRANGPSPSVAASDTRWAPADMPIKKIRSVSMGYSSAWACTQRIAHCTS